MTTTDSTFLAEGSSNPNMVTGVTAWSRPAGNIPFEKGMFGIGVNWGVIGYIDDGTLQLKWPAVSYTGKAGVFGVASADTGAAGTSTTGVGVFGHSGNVTGLAAGLSCGVLGASAAKNGVIGWSSKSEGVRAFSDTGAGVKSTSKKGDGVHATSVNGHGVLGSSTESTGVQGFSSQGRGVHGQSGAAPKINPLQDINNIRGAMAGVFGASKDAAGVIGVSQNQSGVRAFTGGESGSPAVQAIAGIGKAIFGQSLGSGDHNPSIGVWGDASVSKATIGVLGTTSLGIGVIGVSGLVNGPVGPDLMSTMDSNDRNIAAVLGTSDQQAGVAGTSNALMGVYGYSTSNAGVVGRTDAPQSFGGYFFGNVHLTGTITSDTLKGAVVPFPDGTKRLLVCMESPEPWFEDFGTAKLKRGRAVVKIDPNFAKVIKPDYRVFVTPEGECRGLCVRRKRAASFEVRELMGGTSNVVFSYRIVGLRKDIKGYKCFAKIDTRLWVPARAIRGSKQAPSSSAMRTLFDALEKRRRSSIPARGHRRSKQRA
jgi:hypothetical protein